MLPGTVAARIVPGFVLGESATICLTDMPLYGPSVGPTRQCIGVEIADRFKISIGPTVLRAQHGVAPHQVGDDTQRVPIRLCLGGEIGMADHPGAAGAIVDDDPVTAPFFNVLGKQPRGDIHSAAGRIDYSELDRAGRKILWLELGIRLGAIALSAAGVASRAERKWQK
jgi:hypothetical protein